MFDPTTEIGRGEAEVILGLSASGVRSLDGDLAPRRTSEGSRRYDRRVVEAVRDARASAKAAKAAPRERRAGRLDALAERAKVSP